MGLLITAPRKLQLSTNGILVKTDPRLLSLAPVVTSKVIVSWCCLEGTERKGVCPVLFYSTFFEIVVV